jgi:sugar phosphate permease
MGWMTRFWQFECLCIVEVLGYVLAGPIPNQVLISRWFSGRRGRAMGCAYLGLGLGGVVAPLLINYLAHTLGWRHALQLLGAVILVVLFPVAIWVTRSAPEERGIGSEPGVEPEMVDENLSPQSSSSMGVAQAVRSASFWLLLAGSTLVIGTIGAVVQHFILFLKDAGYSATVAARFSTILLASSLGGRVMVGYLADRLPKTRLMTFFYLLIGASVFLLVNPQSSALLWTFAIIFGFSMGADYMLIPLVTAECFGTAALGKLLALIIMGYSIGQWAAPWIVGRIFDARHSYDLAWKSVAIAGILGATAIYAVPSSSRRIRA